METADNIGICPERSANYNQSKIGTKNLFECMSKMVCDMREDKGIAPGWSEGLDEK